MLWQTGNEKRQSKWASKTKKETPASFKNFFSESKQNNEGETCRNRRNNKWDPIREAKGKGGGYEDEKEWEQEKKRIKWQSWRDKEVRRWCVFQSEALTPNWLRHWKIVFLCLEGAFYMGLSVGTKCVTANPGERSTCDSAFVCCHCSQSLVTWGLWYQVYFLMHILTSSSQTFIWTYNI